MVDYASTSLDDERRSAPTGAAAALPAGLTLGPARLVVRELERSLAFYRSVVGVDEVAARDGDIARLGTTDGAIVLELVERPDAQPLGRTAGLYHLALLYPTRAELARTAHRIAQLQVPIQGASDHRTHEAIYLTDPDGNGLELAVDRPRAEWPSLDPADPAAVAAMRPAALDVADLLAAARAADAAGPAATGLATGHLHLTVGDADRASAFYVDVVGFAQMMRFPGASFVAAGGYHHHLGLNSWKGEGVPAAPPGSLGLARWSARVPRDADLAALIGRLVGAGADHEVSRAPDGSNLAVALRDPWGHELWVALDVR